MKSGLMLNFKQMFATFHEATKLPAGTKCPTCNLLFEEFCEILLLLIDYLKNRDDTIVAMNFAMKRKFDKYWDVYNKIFMLATFLECIRCLQSPITLLDI